jgi:hypothetical protein
VPVSLTIFQCRPKHPSRRLMPHYGTICRHPLGTALTWMPGPEDRDQPQVVDLRGRKRDELGGHGQKKRKKRRCTRPWARHLGRQAPEKHCVGTIAVPVGARSKGRSASRDWGLDECTAICAHQGGQRNRVALALFDGCESRQWAESWAGMADWRSCQGETMAYNYKHHGPRTGPPGSWSWTLTQKGN